MKIGIVGVGAITSDVARAIEEFNPGEHIFYLSPRSKDRSSELAAIYPNFYLLESNQEVVDKSDLIFIGVLPTQIDELLSELDFREDQVIASMAAGKAPSYLRSLITPATKVAQLIPLPMIQYKVGPIVICPPIPEITQLLIGLGDLIQFDDDSLIPVFSSASAAMSTIFEQTNSIASWMKSQGVTEDLSIKYSTALVEAIGVKANKINPEQLKEQPAKHETPGGLNESVRLNLQKRDWFNDLTDQLDYLLKVFIPNLKNRK